MFCPKCGTVLEEGATFCPKCGLDLSTVEQKENKDIQSETAGHVETVAGTSTGTASHVETVTGTSTGEDSNVIKYVYFGLAAVVLIMFFMAAHDIISGGNEIMQIQSVGGQTLEEAYYYELGSVYAGYAMVARALGIFFASVLVWLGLKN